MSDAELDATMALCEQRKREADRVWLAITGLELGLNALEELRPDGYGDRKVLEPIALGSRADNAVRNALVDIKMLIADLVTEHMRLTVEREKAAERVQELDPPCATCERG